MKPGWISISLVQSILAGFAVSSVVQAQTSGNEPVGGETVTDTSASTEKGLEPPSFDIAKDIAGGFRIGSGKRPNMDRANIRFGNLVVDLVGFFKTTYDNNINQSNNNPLWDVIFETGAELNTFWEINSVHSFSFNTNVSYFKYLRNSQYDSANNFLNIQPDSELAYYLKLGSVTAKIFDRLSYQVQPGNRYFLDSTSGQLSTSVQYPRWDNQAGISFGWEPVKDWQSSFTSTRSDTIPQDKLYENLRRTTYGHQATLDHNLNRDLTLGLFAGWTETAYKTTFNNDSQGLNYGYRAVYSFNPFLVGSWRHTFNDMTFSRGGANGDGSDYSGQNYEIGLTHQPFREISHSLQWSRSSDLGTAANTRETDTYSYQISYSGLAEASLYAQYSIATSGDSGGLFAEESELSVISVGYSRALTRKLTMGAVFTHNLNESNFNIGNYTKDQLVLSLSYDF